MVAVGNQTMSLMEDVIRSIDGLFGMPSEPITTYARCFSLWQRNIYRYHSDDTYPRKISIEEA